MRRSLSYLTVLVLLAVGGYFTQQVVTLGSVPLFRLPSPLPELPMFDILGYQVPGALLLALIAGFVLFNVIGMGVTLAVLTSRAGRELQEGGLTVKAAGEEKPVKKVEAVPPSKPLSERTAIGFVVAFLLLGVIWAYGRFTSPLPQVPPAYALPGGVEVPAWAVLGAVVSALVGGTVVMGVALARLFAIMNQQLAETAAMPPKPLDLQAPIRKLIGLTKVRLTFFDKVFTCLDAFLVVVILGVLAAFVVPAYLRVAEVDRAALALNAEPTAAPTAVSTAAAPAQDPQAEFAALPPGDAAAGETTFKGLPCAGCHSLASEVVIVGPSLAGVATRAESRVPGYSPEAYLFESIVRPNAHVVESFQPGVMPQNFRETLSDQQIADLIAYMSSQK